MQSNELRIEELATQVAELQGQVKAMREISLRQQQDLNDIPRIIRATLIDDIQRGHQRLR